MSAPAKGFAPRRASIPGRRSRALRVGVLIADSLVEEKLVDTTQPVTFGQSLRCTLSVPVDGVPREHVLFAVDGGRLVLRITAAMDGRLVQLDQVATFDELRAAASAHDGTWTIPLAQGARGKLCIGDATLLFQELARPIVPRVQLPAAIRGTLLDRVDRRLAAIIGGSLAVHIGIAAWAWATDAPRFERELPAVATFEQQTIDLSPPEPPAPATTPGPGAATPIAPPHTTHVPTRVPTPQLPPKLGTDDALKLASILSGDETAHTGVGGMSPHRPGSGLEKELEDIQSSHHEVTIGDDGRGPRTTSTRIDRTPVTIPIDGPDPTRLDPTKEPTEKRGRVKLEGAKADDHTTLTADAVLDLINTQYMAGLQRCYRKGLVGDPELSGKVSLSLTVDESGKVTEPAATGADAAVDHCIHTLMGVWRFPIPHDSHGEPTDATFHISLALRPS